MDAAFVQFERGGAWLELIMTRTARALWPLLLVPARFRQAHVTPDPPTRRPGPSVHTAWLPRSRSPSDMDGATMQYRFGTRDARAAEALPVLRVSRWRAGMLSASRWR